jgi:diacylglycerol kinase family enzyme
VRSPLSDLYIGAIGLGSSNDFHKPRGIEPTISGIPVAIDPSRATPRDAVAVRVTAGGRSETRWLLLNGGVGFTADANVRFNDGRRPGRLLRRLSTSAAILAAIAGTLARLRDTELSVSLPNEQPLRVSVTNLAVLVSPYVSGSLAFPSAWTAPGAMGVVLLSKATRRHLLRFVAGLLRGRCADSARCSHRLTTSLTVASDTPVPLEIDGEIVRGERFEFTLHPRLLMVCT